MRIGTEAPLARISKAREISLNSDRYDFTISLLHLEAFSWSSRFEDAEDEVDVYDRMVGRATDRS
jgi:hypothetical protein